MRKAVEMLTASREPLPADDEARLRLAQRTAVILLGTGSFLGLASAAIALPADPPGFRAVGVVVASLFSLAFLPVLVLVRLSWPSLYVFLGTSTVVVTVGVASAGAAYALGAVLYLWAVMLAFLFFGRMKAIGITALVAAEYALVVAVGDGFAAPVGWWLFLVVTAVVTGAVLDWLVGRTRSLAEAERAARVELESAHRELEAVLADREELNHTLEERVAQQVRELASLGELRRFLSPQVLHTVLQEGQTDLLEPHRREISVFFCDLRGFTAFTSEVEPEEVLAVLAEYYGAVGALFREFDATIGPLSGDGVMAYFNDPVPCDEASLRAVELAIAVQAACSRFRSGGPSAVTSWAAASVWPLATPRWASSGSRASATTGLWAASSTAPHDCATRRPPDRSSSTPPSSGR